MKSQISQSSSDEYIAKCRDDAFVLLKASPSVTGSGRPKIVSFAKRIEHTSLKIDSCDEDIIRLCREALQHGFRSVCCLPRDVSQCKKILKNESVLVVTVLNFPLAGGSDHCTRQECAIALNDGADELDMVVDVRALKRGDLTKVHQRIACVVKAAGGKPVKVILETGCLTPRQIVEGSVASWVAGASYVKTSTGFGPRGASVEDVSTMRLTVGENLGIKASGGIREADFAHELVNAGADLLGTSSGISLF